MLYYPNIDPIAISIGPINIYWYGICYLVAFLCCWFLLNRASKDWNNEQIADLIFYVAVGVIFGGRIGYVLFYETSSIFNNPLVLIKFWQGRSFHGGLLGVILSLLVFAKLQKRALLEITDFIAPVVPIGLGLGRLGNFINGELYGRHTDTMFGMIFSFVDNKPRHPTQLYELFFEGIILFIILHIYKNRAQFKGQVSGMFLTCYGIFRFFVEFFREPDLHLGFIAFGKFTMGQILSIPMVICGIFLIFSNNFSNKGKNNLCNNT